MKTKKCVVYSSFHAGFETGECSRTYSPDPMKAHIYDTFKDGDGFRFVEEAYSSNGDEIIVPVEMGWTVVHKETGIVQEDQNGKIFASTRKIARKLCLSDEKVMKCPKFSPEFRKAFIADARKAVKAFQLAIKNI